MLETKCPECGGDLACLSGRSAHESNWYCRDEEGCGWQAWDRRVRKPAQDKKIFSGNQSRDLWNKINGIDNNSTDDDIHRALYAMAISLQQLEAKIDKLNT